MNSILFLREGLRMLKRRVSVQSQGIKKYEGNANDICREILENCWNGTYVQVSAGHFCEFYARDFGWIVQSLMKLGQEDRVQNTLTYALKKYHKAGKITTTLSPEGRAFDFPTYAPDSLAFMLFSLRTAKAYNLVEKYRTFLNQELQRAYTVCYDPELGLIKRKTHFSSMKDHAVTDSSCYNNVMLAVMQREAKLLKLENPFKTNFKNNFKNTIKKHFWTGEYFLDDLSGTTHIAGDANLFPFWTGIFDEKSMLRKAIVSIKKAHLDSPIPLRYTSKTVKSQEKMIYLEAFAQAYERDTCWMHMGPLFIEMVTKVDREQARRYLSKIKKLIERDQNYLELYWESLKPFSSPFYYADESMSWCANYLTLAEELYG